MKQKVCIIGAGYAGLVTGVCFASWGHQVMCIDKNVERIEMLQRGELPFFEPGLDSLMKEAIQKGCLSFSIDIKSGIENSDFLFVIVGTPTNELGDVDISDLLDVTSQIALYMKEFKTIVIRSTVPPGTCATIRKLIEKKQSKRVEFEIVFNPEFIREGDAINTVVSPVKVVIGGENKESVKKVADFYEDLEKRGIPILKTTLESAELVKYACNGFIATRISFVNEMARLCEYMNADVKVISRAIALDGQIGSTFLNAGIGFGGSCLPKDTRALIKLSEKAGLKGEIIRSVVQVNKEQIELVVKKVKRLLGNSLKNKTAGLLGLSFRPNTDDIREAPSLNLIERLLEEKMDLKVFDPQAMEKVKSILGDRVYYCDEMYSVARRADILIIVTEWKQFKELDLTRVKRLLRRPNLLDCRNIYSSQEMKFLGFCYDSIGQGGK